MRRYVMLIVLSVIPSQLLADDQGFYMKVTCDKKNETMLIESMAPYEGGESETEYQKAFSIAPGLPSGECVFRNGHQVRLKISEGIAMPYGECGADPEIYISIWIDKAKVVSRKQVAGRCAKILTRDITISRSGMKWCTKIDPYGHWGGDEVPGCNFTPGNSFPKTRDFVEYPKPASKPRPKPGTIVLDYASDKNFCIQMAISDDGISPPKGSSVNLFTDTAAWEYNGHFEKGEFDIDNDGVPESVVRLRAETHYLDADIFFVSTDEYIDNNWLGVNEKMLIEHSKYIYPCSWHVDAKKKDACEPYGSIEDYQVKGFRGTETTSYYKNKGGKYYYVFRYLHIDPFLYDGNTYLLATPLHEFVYTVFRPKSGGKADEICVFRKIQENY